MKQTIKIEVPEGKKAVWKDGKIVFKDIDLPNTWEEFCSITRRDKDLYYISENGNILWTIRNNINPITDKDLLSSKNIAKQHSALMQLHLLRDYYRQGWIPSSNDIVYTIRIALDIDIVIEGTNFNSFLSFQSKEIAEKFRNNFRDLIKQAGDLVC